MRHSNMLLLISWNLWTYTEKWRRSRCTSKWSVIISLAAWVIWDLPSMRETRQTRRFTSGLTSRTFLESSVIVLDFSMSVSMKRSLWFQGFSSWLIPRTCLVLRMWSGTILWESVTALRWLIWSRVWTESKECWRDLSAYQSKPTHFECRRNFMNHICFYEN